MHPVIDPTVKLPESMIRGRKTLRQVHRVPKRLKGKQGLLATLDDKERDLVDEFIRIHKREPTYLEREIIEEAMSHVSRAAGLSLLLDMDFDQIRHSDKVSTWEKSGSAHRDYIKAICRLGLDKGASKMNFKDLMMATAVNVTDAPVTAQEGETPSVITEPRDIRYGDR